MAMRTMVRRISRVMMTTLMRKTRSTRARQTPTMDNPPMKKEKRIKMDPKPKHPTNAGKRLNKRTTMTTHMRMKTPSLQKSTRFWLISKLK
jgi:hypothetical protein